MNVATITMPRQEAVKKLAQYKKSLQRRANDEYSRAAAAYVAAAEGKALVVLSEVILAAPRDEKQRPRIAIARADREQVEYQRWGTNEETFSILNANSQLRDREVRVATGHVLPPSHHGRSYVNGYAMIPMTPPDVRGTKDLSRLFVLWEVEAWADRPLGVQPDRDPFLLERLADDLFAVVGEWELTEIERAIMSSRRPR
jgi:hypothetical protein